MQICMIFRYLGKLLQKCLVFRRAVLLTQRRCTNTLPKKSHAPLTMAARIKARAVRRAGELLQQIDDGKGRNQFSKGGVGDHTFSRTDAARDAGMSKHQQVLDRRIIAANLANPLCI